jgi:hypothetical protein
VGARILIASINQNRAFTIKALFLNPNFIVRQVHLPDKKLALFTLYG